MSDAEKVVNDLLNETFVRACLSCEKEFGVKVPDASHGYCKRHMIDMYREIEKVNNTPGMYDDKIAEISIRPDEGYSPDMAKQQPQGSVPGMPPPKASFWPTM